MYKSKPVLAIKGFPVTNLITIANQEPFNWFVFIKSKLIEFFLSKELM